MPITLHTWQRLEWPHTRFISREVKPKTISSRKQVVQSSEPLWAAQTYLIAFKLFVRAGFAHWGNPQQFTPNTFMPVLYEGSVGTGGAQHQPSSALVTADVLCCWQNHLCSLLWKFFFRNSPCQAMTDKGSPGWWAVDRITTEGVSQSH